MKIIGLTGGIGSGKTTVLNFFKEFNIPVYISDIEAKKLMHTSIEVMDKIKNLFGEKAYLHSELNRAYIASIVFGNKEKLKLLNEIVHPAVHNDFKEFLKKQKAPYVIYESALLFENNSESQFDKIVLVVSPMQLRIDRIMKRDNSSIADIQVRISNQLSDEKKIDRADYIISNINRDDTKNEVAKLHKILQS